MSTIKQQKLAQEIVFNLKRKKPLNKTKLLDSVGYSKKTQHKKAGEIINQVGVQRELEVLGFNKTNAKEVVRDIMLDPNVKPNDRLKATDQVFKTTGAYEPEPPNKYAGWTREMLIDSILEGIYPEEYRKRKNEGTI